MMRTRWIAACILSLSFSVAPAAGAIVVRVVPSSVEVVEGRLFSVDLVADLDVPVLGWGLDFGPLASLPPLGPLAVLEGDPVLGSAWLPLPGTDDGLAGAAFPDGISGDGILLASVSLRALRPGNQHLFASATLDDPTEGFALDPSGFAADVMYGSTFLTVRPVPEPGTGLLLAFGLVLLARLRRG